MLRETVITPGFFYKDKQYNRLRLVLGFESLGDGRCKIALFDYDERMDSYVNAGESFTAEYAIRELSDFLPVDEIDYLTGKISPLGVESNDKFKLEFRRLGDCLPVGGTVMEELYQKVLVS